MPASSNLRQPGNRSVANAIGVDGRGCAPPAFTRRAALLAALSGAAAFAAALTGCSLFQEQASASKKNELPTPPPAPDSAALEIAFVRIKPDEEPTWNAQWRGIDEQVVDYETRQALQANGFRVGLVGQQLPPFLRTLLDRQKEDVAEQLQGEAAERSGVRVSQAGDGKRREIVATPVRDEIVILTQEEGALKGDSYLVAQCVFEAKTFVESDGRTRIEIVPEVHYGELKTQYVGHNGSYLMEPRRERVAFRLLRTEVVMSPGQTLVISAAPEPIGLGKNFFVQPPEEGDASRKILLVRLAAAPDDPLFHAANKGEPVETPAASGG